MRKLIVLLIALGFAFSGCSKKIKYYCYDVTLDTAGNYVHHLETENIKKFKSEADMKAYTADKAHGCFLQSLK